MNEEFMKKLNNVRMAFNAPMVITSAYRCEKHNDEVSASKSGAHTKGRAVDVAVSGSDAFRLVKCAIENGMTGVGVSQKGSHRFIHLDDETLPDFPRPNVWSY